MIINIKDVLTLDNDYEYVVVSKTCYNNQTYYYLLNKSDFKDMKFCYIDQEDLVEIKDQQLITKLLPLFLKENNFN